MMESLFSENIYQDDKLSFEIERLELLRDALNRSNQMTDIMSNSLTAFENRLIALEENINPVYLETVNLQRRHENVEKTLVAVDRVLAFYDVADKVEPTIREGPGSEVIKYIECMDELKKAVDFFNANNPDSSEIAHATSIFEAGKERLEREFDSLLTRHSSAPAPIAILDVLSSDDDCPKNEVNLLEKFPISVKNDLILISEWLQNCGYQPDCVRRYTQIRGSILLKSMSGLRDHLKKSSKEMSSVSSLNSPALISKRAVSREPVSRKGVQKHMDFVRRASTSLMRGSSSHLDVSLKKSSTDLSYEGFEIDIDFFITGSSALLKLIQNEDQLMKNIIPQKLERQVFDQIIQVSMEKIKKEGELIGTGVKKATVRHDHISMLSVFPILKHLRSIKEDFDLMLEGCQTPTKATLAGLITVLDDAGLKALDDFRDSVKNDPDKGSNMPSDGTVHELTSNTIIFLEHLMEFAETAGCMLLIKDSTTSKQNQASEKKKKIGEYITKVLSALGLNLNNKAETYNDVTIKAIFMLNNYNYILTSLRKNGIMEIARLASRDLDNHLEDQILEQKRFYSQSWSKVIHHIYVDTSKPSLAQKVKDKERQAIKDKFAGFNKEIEEIVKIQKNYAIPDDALRNSLCNDNKNFILPKYKLFLETYDNVSFTKNPEKYLKYSLEGVEKLIEKFFDTAS